MHTHSFTFLHSLTHTLTFIHTLFKASGITNIFVGNAQKLFSSFAVAVWTLSILWHLSARIPILILFSFFRCFVPSSNGKSFLHNCYHLVSCSFLFILHFIHTSIYTIYKYNYVIKVLLWSLILAVSFVLFHIWMLSIERLHCTFRNCIMRKIYF